MSGASTASGQVTFAGTVSTPVGGSGVPVPLVAYCGDGLYAGTTVATATGSGSGGLSVTLPLTSARCAYRWEVTDSTAYMGAATDAVRVVAEPNQPGDQPPRER
jgi:hypothetical protein